MLFSYSTVLAFDAIFWSCWKIERSIMPTPTEVGSALYTVLLENSKDGGLADESFQSMVCLRFNGLRAVL